MLRNFSIENVVIPDEDESINKLKATLSKKADMEILGYSYKDERGLYDCIRIILLEIVKNIQKYAKIGIMLVSAKIFHPFWWYHVGILKTDVNYSSDTFRTVF